MRFTSAHRLLPVVGFAVVAVFVACSSGSKDDAPLQVSESSNPANVVITMYAGATSAVSGTCAGTVVAPRAVLTSAHCVAGKSGWKVSTVSGKLQTVGGVRGLTYDWATYGSAKSHPDKSDVAIIELADPIVLDTYPTLASSAAPEGTALSRIRRAPEGLGLSKSHMQSVTGAARLGNAVGFSRYYYTRTEAGEVIDTGGAVIDPKTNTIYGIVSGQGTKTHALYVARVDASIAGGWVTTNVKARSKAAPGSADVHAPNARYCYGNCSGYVYGDTTDTTPSSVLCDASYVCGPDGGTRPGTTGGSSTGGTNGGSTTSGSSTSGSSTGGATTGGASTGGTNGSNTGGTGQTTAGSTGGSSTGSTGGTSGSSTGGTGGSSTGGTNGSNTGGTGQTTSGTGGTGGTGGATNGGTNGSNTGGPGQTTAGTGGTGGGGGGGGTGGDCDGPECGGCDEQNPECEDETIDYGDCDCGGPKTTGPIY